MAEYARSEINGIGGYYAYGRELVNGNSIYDYDVTKLSVYTRDIGLAGIEVYDLLRDEYDIQIEFGDIGNILAYISIGDRIQDIERFVGALSDIKRLYAKDTKGMLSNEYIAPRVGDDAAESVLRQKGVAAAAADTRPRLQRVRDVLPARDSDSRAGEVVTEDIIDYIEYAKEKGCSMQGTEDPTVCRLNVLMEGSY